MSKEPQLPDIFKKYKKDYQKYLKTGTQREIFVKNLNDLFSKIISFESIYGIKLKLDIEDIDLKKHLERITDEPQQ